MGKTPFMLAE